MNPPAIASAFLLGIISILAGCGKESATQAAEVKTETAPAANPLEIEVRPDLLLQVKVGEPVWQNVSDSLSVPGRIETDETRMVRVSAPVTGRILDLNVIEGQIVQKGQVIATLYSTDLAAAQSSFIKAISQQQLAERSVARAQQLLDAGVIGSAELQRREVEAQQNAAELSSSRKQLNVLGMPDEAIQRLEATRTIDSTTQVVAAASGQVIDRMVTPGQVVQAAESLCIVADMSNVWLVADVPEQDAQQLRVGGLIEAEIPALPGQKIRGKLSFVSPTVDRETRTIRARMNLPNTNLQYKPLMLVNVTLLDKTERRRVVPATAVVRDGNDEGIFVQTAPNIFMLHRVMLGDEVGDQRVLLDGIPPGSKIVTEGAFHLNNERRRLSTKGDAGA